jgi:hypothetical protein
MNNLQRAIEEVTKEVVGLRRYGEVDGIYFQGEHNYLELMQEVSTKICDLFEGLELEITNNITCISIKYKYAEVNLVWMSTKWVSLVYPLPNKRVLVVPKQDLIYEYVLQRLEWLLNQ